MMLSALILLPLVGAVLLGLQRGLDARGAGRQAGIWALVIAFLAAIPNPSKPAEWTLAWMDDGAFSFRFAIDGISWLFLVLTGVVTLLAILASLLWEKGSRAYFALILVIESALFGVFTARHFIPWFLFWEMTLIPAFLLIHLWGGTGARKAALRFFIATLGGSAFLLVGFLALQFAVGTMDFDALAKLATRSELAPKLATAFGLPAVAGHNLLVMVALAVLLGLAVKIPIVPLHIWLPAAYTEAPTPVTMILTGLLSKMGVYGLLRIFLPVFPEVLPSLAPLLLGLSVATILLGAVAALAQSDLKRMMAYSSVNHLGYCALAIAAVAAGGGREEISSAITGVVYQAFNHGIIAAALFFGIGILEQRSGGRRGLSDFGGLRSAMPVFCGLFGIATFASLGLPGLGGFVGEFLIFNGVFGLKPLAASLSAIGLLLTAVFLLRMIRKVFAGPLRNTTHPPADLCPSERGLLGAAVAIMFLTGLLPAVLFSTANPAILELVKILHP
ncbi:MAG: NADH-quinone oxidoreductase subunit M [Akkermansiaceae bacterium]|nr:NADH-quinone oxidoreductase subunit M [Akkermansiaceae bacterium]